MMNQFTTKDGAKIAFQYHSGNDTVVVFLHGAYIASNEWRPQLDALDGRSYLLVDFRGHGQSDRVGIPYSVEQFSSDVWQLIDYLHLEGIVVCGHSLGGMVAQQLAAEHPRLVSKLILADTSYGVRSTRMEALATDLTMPLFNRIPVSWQAKLFASQLSKHSDSVKDYVEEEIGRHAADKQNYRAIWQAVTSFDGYEQLASIKAETLILAGEKNKQTHRQAQMIHERIPDTRLVFIERAGHMLNWDNPKQFNQELVAFIA